MKLSAAFKWDKILNEIKIPERVKKQENTYKDVTAGHVSAHACSCSGVGAYGGSDQAHYRGFLHCARL